MGAKQAKFDEEKMKEMLAITSLNRTEIYHTFSQFQQIHGEYIPEADEEIVQILNHDGFINPDVSLPTQYIIDNIPVLKVNPLHTRICEVFSEEEEGRMSFLEFLDMVSAFNTKTPKEDRIVYAFRIYDIDGDGIISRKDLERVLDLLTGDGTVPDNKDEIITGVFREVNKEDNCDGLSTEDFGYAISRSPDFATTFSFRL